MHSGEQMILEDYLYISLKRRANAAPLFKLQLFILEDLITAERAIAGYKAHLSEREAPSAQPSNETDQEEIHALRREIFVWEAQRRALRDIVDGIAWRLFDYDRAVLYMLADANRNPHIELGGLATELRVLGQVLNEHGGLAVLNDMTHFLKIGDVTVKMDDGSFDLIEVKAGHKKSGRITRQRQRMQEVVTFLNAGERDEDGRRFIVRHLDTVPESLIAPVAKVIQAASRKGAAVDRIGDHLIVACTDFAAIDPNRLGDAKRTFSTAFDWADQWTSAGDLVLPSIGQDRYKFVRNFAPYSVFPVPEAARVKLAAGTMMLQTFINISRVLRYFESMGWRVIKRPEEHLKDAEEGQAAFEGAFVTLRKDHFTTTVPAALFKRIGGEFLKPKSLLAALEGIRASESSPGEFAFPSFLHEAELWD
jgi:hypothetical protein